MGVGVDKPREHDRVTEIDCGSRRMPPTHGNDAAPLDSHPPAIQRRTQHREQMPTAERDALTAKGRHGVVDTSGMVDSSGRVKPGSTAAGIPIPGSSSISS